MLPGCCKNGIVISKIPVMQAGLKEVMRTHFPEYEIISSASAEDLTLLQLRRSGLVIADLAGESEDPRSVCEHYYSLISQYRGNSLGFHGVTLLVFPGSRITHVPYGDVIV
ncbi:transcriptional regulator [Escherichia coli]|nr:transcriptional regulator [Escherichia coli]